MPVERATGIEPAYPAWEAGALPLSYARTGRRRPPQGGAAARGVSVADTVPARRRPRPQGPDTAWISPSSRPSSSTCERAEATTPQVAVTLEQFFDGNDCEWCIAPTPRRGPRPRVRAATCSSRCASAPRCTTFVSCSTSSEFQTFPDDEWPYASGVAVITTLTGRGGRAARSTRRPTRAAAGLAEPQLARRRHRPCRRDTTTSVCGGLVPPRLNTSVTPSSRSPSPCCVASRRCSSWSRSGCGTAASTSRSSRSLGSSKPGLVVHLVLGIQWLTGDRPDIPALTYLGYLGRILGGPTARLGLGRGLSAAAAAPQSSSSALSSSLTSSCGCTRSPPRTGCFAAGWCRT